MNPAKIEKMEEEIAKWRKKDPIAIKRSMAKPGVCSIPNFLTDWRWYFGVFFLL